MQRAVFNGFCLSILSIYILAAIFIPLMDVDAAQYASIAREMEESGNWLMVKHKYVDYLDKPPLLFWLSALFFKFFGVNHFVYRLPSLIVSVVGIWGTFKVASKLYNQQTGYLSVLILASCQAWFLFHHDVRTDTLLAGFVMIAIWQLLEFDDHKKVKHFIFGFVSIGMAMLAKGPIGAIIPAAALGAYWLGMGAWRKILQWKWLLGGVIILLILSPMLYGLYLQYQEEGIYFYFWKQSFGRITGENSWKNDSGAFYFVHTFLWSFLPWSLPAFGVLINRFFRFWNRGADLEMLNFGAFILVFVALSFSNYKLPHYIFPLYPFIAMLLANEIGSSFSENKKSVIQFFRIYSYLILCLVFVLIFTSVLFVFPVKSTWIWILIFVLIVVTFYILRSNSLKHLRPIYILLSSMISLNLILGLHFYPTIMKYQSGTQVAVFINKMNIPTDEVACFKIYPNSLDFYMKDIAQVFESTASIVRAVSVQPLWIYTNEEGKKNLEESGLIIEQSISFDHFHISKLKIKFLNPKTRDKTIEKVYLIRIVAVLG